MSASPAPQITQASLSYEVSLWGEISGDADAINPIINRFTLNTEITQKLHIRDVIFDPNEEAAVNEPIYLRCRCDMAKPNSPWSILTYGRPQSERISPDAVVRPVAVMQVSAGNALAFASALGYKIRSDTIKEGYLFTRGSLTIHMFHAPQTSKDTEVIDVDPEPDSNQSWNVDIRQYPVLSVKDTTVTDAIDNVLGFKLLMKGLLDLEHPHSAKREQIHQFPSTASYSSTLRTLGDHTTGMPKKQQSRITQQEPPEIQEGTWVCRVGVARGGSQFEVWNGEDTWLVELPKRFRNTVWIRRGSFVLVSTINSSTYTGGVRGEVTFVLLKEHISQLKKQGQWPSSLDRIQNVTSIPDTDQDMTLELEGSDSAGSPSDSELFRNDNRR